MFGQGTHKPFNLMHEYIFPFLDWHSTVNQGAVADPGFPLGECRPGRGVPTPEAATFRKIYVKTKESGPLGGAGGAPWIRQWGGGGSFTRVKANCLFVCLTVCDLCLSFQKLGIVPV